MDSIAKKPPSLNSLRYYIMIVGLISPFVTTYSRTIINFAIIDMVNPNMVEKHRPIQTGPVVTNLNNSAGQAQQYYFDLDGSCPVDDETRKRLIEASGSLSDHKQTDRSQEERYDWGTFKQGILKSAYALGHFPFQVPGSRMSEIYGSHRIMSFGTFLIGVCCLFAPYLASVSFYLIYCDLILLGTIGSFMTPALINLVTNWLTPSEKSFTMSLYLVTSRLGYALSSILCGLLINANYSWRHVFFSAGWISLSYSTLFFICARNRPIDHPLIGELEMNYLANKNRLVAESLTEAKEKKETNDKYELKSVSVGSRGSKSKERDIDKKELTVKEPRKTNKAPWRDIFTSVPVWAFIITKFCVKLAGDAVQIELPIYLSKVMHFTARSNGLINSLNYVIFCISALAVGAFGKIVMKKRPLGLSKTTLRKCFQGFASFGVSSALIGISLSICNSAFTQLWLMLLFFFTTFGVAGEAQIPIDITERYSGTIHAIGSTLAISGIIEPLVVGFFLREHAADQSSWQTVWLVASGIAAFGGIIFVLFADATIQPFDTVDRMEIDVVSKRNENDDSRDKDNKGEERWVEGFENGAFEHESAEVKRVQDRSIKHKESRVI